MTVWPGPQAEDVGRRMHEWARDLFPLPRSLSGDGVRQTLTYLATVLPGLVRHEVPSGEQVFDWIVPDEWNLRRAWLEDEQGRRIIDSAVNTLHVVGYSVPVDEWFTLEELQPHLRSLPDQPDAVPYVTSYYKRSWGLCLSQRQRDALVPGRYRVVIDATLAPGSLSYGEWVLPGETDSEILLSTYVCHPQMANNELSGPVLAAALGNWLTTLPRRRFTYRLLFLPETIGAIAYMAGHLAHMQAKVAAGFVLTCVGDERTWSYVPSRTGDTLADRVIRHWLKHRAPAAHVYSFMDRGSDERQYCSPGANLPVASLMRSKYHTFPEYHTSLDDLTLVTPMGLGQSYAAYQEILMVLENNETLRCPMVGEPQLGKYGLYPSAGTRDTPGLVRTMLGLISHADGTNDTIALAEIVGAAAWEVVADIRRLKQAGVLVTVDERLPAYSEHGKRG